MCARRPVLRAPGTCVVVDWKVRRRTPAYCPTSARPIRQNVPRWSPSPHLRPPAVQLPFEVIRTRFVTNLCDPRQPQRRSTGHPTVFVDCAIAYHLEIVNRVLRRRLFVIERIDQTSSL